MEKQEDSVETSHGNTKLDHYIALAQKLLRDLIQAEGFDCHSLFNSQTIPNIDMAAFMRRIHRYTQYSSECLILAIIYLDRYNMNNPEFCLNQLNVHKVYLTCILIANKFHDDFYYDNKAYELAGGVTTSELFKFQLQLYSRIQFQTFVGEEQFHSLLQRLEDVYNNNQQMLE